MDSIREIEAVYDSWRGSVRCSINGTVEEWIQAIIKSIDDTSPISIPLDDRTRCYPLLSRPGHPPLALSRTKKLDDSFFNSGVPVVELIVFPSLKHFRFAADCCRLAYGDANVQLTVAKYQHCGVPEFPCLVICTPNTGLPNKLQRRVVAVAFRGSVTKEDWICNGDIFSESGVLAGTRHGGFSARAKTIPVALMYYLLQKYDEVIITGHSMGGAVASLVTCNVLSTLYSRNKPKWVEKARKKLCCITFGAPLFCDDFNAEVFRGTGYDNFIHHVVNIGDIVPRVLAYLPKIEKKLGVTSVRIFGIVAACLNSAVSPKIDEKDPLTKIADATIGSAPGFAPFGNYVLLQKQHLQSSSPLLLRMTSEKFLSRYFNAKPSPSDICRLFKEHDNVAYCEMLGTLSGNDGLPLTEPEASCIVPVPSISQISVTAEFLSVTAEVPEEGRGRRKLKYSFKFTISNPSAVAAIDIVAGSPSRVVPQTIGKKPPLQEDLDFPLEPPLQEDLDFPLELDQPPTALRLLSPVGTYDVSISNIQMPVRTPEQLRVSMLPVKDVYLTCFLAAFFSFLEEATLGSLPRSKEGRGRRKLKYSFKFTISNPSAVAAIDIVAGSPSRVVPQTIGKKPPLQEDLDFPLELDQPPTALRLLSPVGTYDVSISNIQMPVRTPEQLRVSMLPVKDVYLTCFLSCLLQLSGGGDLGESSQVYGANAAGSHLEYCDPGFGEHLCNMARHGSVLDRLDLLRIITRAECLQDPDGKKLDDSLTEWTKGRWTDVTDDSLRSTFKKDIKAYGMFLNKEDFQSMVLSSRYPFHEILDCTRRAVSETRAKPNLQALVLARAFYIGSALMDLLIPLVFEKVRMPESFAEMGCLLSQWSTSPLVTIGSFFYSFGPLVPLIPAGFGILPVCVLPGLVAVASTVLIWRFHNVVRKSLMVRVSNYRQVLEFYAKYLRLSVCPSDMYLEETIVSNDRGVFLFTDETSYASLLTTHALRNHIVEVIKKPTIAILGCDVTGKTTLCHSIFSDDGPKGGPSRAHRSVFPRLHHLSNGRRVLDVPGHLNAKAAISSLSELIQRLTSAAVVICEALHASETPTLTLIRQVVNDNTKVLICLNKMDLWKVDENEVKYLQEEIQKEVQTANPSADVTILPCVFDPSIERNEFSSARDVREWLETVKLDRSSSSTPDAN
eukprot:CAMPEP_0196666768 /NCGR_PEP_ID=MMETSP1086-20130531/64701_1 /TAXON_ID=77921 /ORGANISM="Cyanoptyche  gloeocystis , Strain SAG4.97" /LENGTH=1176 /DNA_ID=CAMNT_0042004007 /DNA_START=136 /DNA_END=3667 /DNA_ORIENTATION=-